MRIKLLFKKKLNFSVVPLIFVLFYFLTGCSGGGGNSPGGGGSNAAGPTPLSTAVGTPITAVLPATANIDSTGGSLLSVDNRLTLSIPAGALSSTITFTIQPITSQAPRGIGFAYRLLPDAETFSKPVEITFNYTDSDLSGTREQSLGIAFQDSHGYWHVPSGLRLDTSQKKLTISTTHLSDWSMYFFEGILPPVALVPVGKSRALTVVICPNSNSDLLTADCANSQSYSWLVNNVPGGDSIDGTIVPSGNNTAVFTANGSRPPPYYVKVTAQDPVAGSFVSNLTIDDCGTTKTNCTYKGTVNGAITGMPFTADVTWTFSHFDNPLEPQNAFFIPTGLLNLTWPSQPCPLIPSTYSISQGDGDLIIDYTMFPPGYNGGGTTFWAANVVCPGGSQPIMAGGSWFIAPAGFMYHVDSYGLVINGNVGPLFWNFIRN